MSLSVHYDVVVPVLDPEQVKSFVPVAAIEQYFQIAAASALAYHTITTIDKEVKYFWGARMTPVTIVYFANRYIGILGATAYLIWYMYGVNISLCESPRNATLDTFKAYSYILGSFSKWTRDISTWVTVIAVDYILMIRVLALYSQARRLAYFLKAFLGLEAVIGLIVFIYNALAEDIMVFSLGPEGPTVCRQGQEGAAKPVTPLGIMCWSIPIVYGALLMALAVRKATAFWRVSGEFEGFNLVRVVIVDQAIYFALVVLSCVFTIAEFKLIVSNHVLSGLLDSFGNSFYLCIMGSVMLFNLKEAGERGLSRCTGYTSRYSSAMEFA